MRGSKKTLLRQEIIILNLMIFDLEEFSFFPIWGCTKGSGSLLEMFELKIQVK